MKAYDFLSTFPDVIPALKMLSETTTVPAVVFSNGTESMVGNSVKSSPDLGPYSSLFQQIVTVEEVQKFKPSPETYYHLARKLGKHGSKAEIGQCWLISGNPFDIVGACAVGMQAIWVDRAGKGWTDHLSKEKPTAIVSGLEEIVDIITGQGT